MMSHRPILAGFMLAALLAARATPALAGEGGSDAPSFKMGPPAVFEDIDEHDLFIFGVLALGGGREIVIWKDAPPQGEYVGPPPPPPATPTTSMATTPTPEQAAQSQLAGWIADLKKKLADPNTSPQDKQVAQNKLNAINQWGNLQQSDAAAAGAPGSR